MNRARKLFRDQRQRGAGGFADAQSEMAGGASHDDDEIPSAGGAGVLHEILHQFAAELARGLETERRYLARQRQVVVDGLRHVADTNTPARLFCHLAGGKHGIVAADGG